MTGAVCGSARADKPALRPRHRLSHGKPADLVILSVDQTAVPAAEIEKIVVLETIKEGKTVWKK